MLTFFLRKEQELIAAQEAERQRAENEHAAKLAAMEAERQKIILEMQQAEEERKQQMTEEEEAQKRAEEEAEAEKERQRFSEIQHVEDFR